MKQTLVLGNIITMDDDGVFVFIGEVEEAKKLADVGTQVLDYGENFIYPGFLEAHSHGCLAGYE